MIYMIYMIYVIYTSYESYVGGGGAPQKRRPALWGAAALWVGGVWVI